MEKQLLLRIHGHVQGVGYRDAMREAAQSLGVQGWVRNRFDGTVEALIRGNADACNALLQWAQRGPPAARVLRIDQTTLSDAQLAGYPEPAPAFQRHPTT